MNSFDSLSGYTSSVFSLAFSLDGRLLASGHRNGEVAIWDLDSRTPLRHIEGHEGGVTSLEFSPDSSLLASGSYDQTAKLWQTDSGREMTTLKPNEPPLANLGARVLVAFSPDGAILATGSERVKLWDVKTSSETRTVDEWTASRRLTRVAAVRIGSDPATLAVGTEQSGEVIHFRLPEGTRVHQVDPIRSTYDNLGLVYGFDIAPNLRTFAWGFDWRGGHWVVLWDSNTGRQLQMLETSHKGSIVQVALSRDGKYVASADITGDVRCWAIETAHPVAQIHRANKVYAVAFSPDGRALAYAGEEASIGFAEFD